MDIDTPGELGLDCLEKASQSLMTAVPGIYMPAPEEEAVVEAAAAMLAAGTKRKAVSVDGAGEDGEEVDVGSGVSCPGDSGSLPTHHAHQGLLLLRQQEQVAQPQQRQRIPFVSSEVQTSAPVVNRLGSTAVHVGRSSPVAPSSSSPSGPVCGVGQQGDRNAYGGVTSPSPLPSSEESEPKSYHHFDQLRHEKTTATADSTRSPAKRPLSDGKAPWPSGDSEAAAALAGGIGRSAAGGEGDSAGGQPVGDGGGVVVDGSGGRGGSGGGSTPPTGGEQTHPSRVHSGEVVLHGHAIKA